MTQRYADQRSDSCDLLRQDIHCRACIAILLEVRHLLGKQRIIDSALHRNRRVRETRGALSPILAIEVANDEIVAENATDILHGRACLVGLVSARLRLSASSCATFISSEVRVVGAVGNPVPAHSQAVL